jgi:hypothetical protein
MNLKGLKWLKGLLAHQKHMNFEGFKVELEKTNVISISSWVINVQLARFIKLLTKSSLIHFFLSSNYTSILSLYKWKCTDQNYMLRKLLIYMSAEVLKKY